MGSPCGRRASAIAVLALALLPAAAAAQNRIWQPSEPLTPAGVSGQAEQLAFTSDGAVVATWVQRYSDGDTFPMSGRVAIKRPGEPVGPPKILDADAGGTPLYVATDAHGRALVAWASSSGELMVARRPDGGEFSDPIDLGEHANLAGLVMNPSGDAALILWNGGPELHAMFGSAGGSFSDPVLLSDDTGRVPGFPIGHLGDDGELVVAWEQDTYASEPGDVRVTTRRPGGERQPTQVLSEPGRWVRSLSLGVDSSGAGAISWQDASQRWGADRTLISERPPGGTFGPQRELDFGQWPEITPMALAPDGTMTLASHGKTWTSRIGEQPQLIRETPYNYHGDPAQIAVSRTSHALVAFNPKGYPGLLVAMSRDSSGELGPLYDVSPTCDRVDYFQLAAGDAGEAAALLQGGNAAPPGQISLAVDAASDEPGRQDCVDNDAMYGREPPPPEPSPPVVTPPPGTPPGPLLVLHRIRTSGKGVRRNTLVDVGCGGPCRLDARAVLRFRGGSALGKGHAAGRTSSGSARLKLRLKLTHRAARAIARHPHRPLRVSVRVAAVSPTGARSVKVATRTAR
jgi:hypothetical protein